MQELLSGQAIEDGYDRSGRKRIEIKLPNLLGDMRAIVDPQAQSDPSFKSTRLYTRISAAEVRRQLIEQKGYADEELPSAETIRVRLNAMGYPVDLVEQGWEQVKDRFAPLCRWVINQDNGSENHSRRTQFMHRMVAVAHQSQLNRPVSLLSALSQ